MLVLAPQERLSQALQVVLFTYFWGRGEKSLNILSFLTVLRGMNNREKFLIEVQKLHILLDAITRKYDMQEEVVNIMLTGMIDTDEMGSPSSRPYTL